MAVSSIKDFWIHPNALTITLNYFGDPQLIQTSMLAGSVIMAYRKDVISYDAAHNFREWKLQAFPTQLNDTCAYYVHAELSRSGDTAMIIYSPVKRDIQGRTLLRVEKDENGRDVEVWNDTISVDSYYIYLGTISASVDNDGATVERAWTDGFYTGTLDTDQQRMEEASGEWKTMFNYNAVTDQIEPLKPFSKIKVMGEAIFQSIAQFVNGLVIGQRKITDVAVSSDSGNGSKVSDATLSTTGFVQKEIEALDDHFLIKDGDVPQEVGGDVFFGDNVSVGGNHSVGGNQTIEGSQEVKGLQTLLGGFKTGEYSNEGGQITGAHLTPEGKLYVAGLKANNFEIDELVFNVVKAQGGEFVYSTSAIISSCTYVMKAGSARLTPNEFYASSTHDWADIDHVEITLKKDELTRSGNPFVVGDIIYGKVNKVSESGKHAVGGQCIMHITEIVDGLNIVAKLYQVGEYGLTDNIPPIEDMTIAHRGNDITHDGNGNEINQDRRTSFYLSTIDGNLVMLHNVTTPTLSAANYGASLGKLPYDLLLEVQKVFAQINETSSVVYADYGIFKNFIQFDLQGQPIQRENNLGEWNFDYADDIGYKNTPSYCDVVTYKGQLYKCLKSGVTLAPDRSSDWLLLVAKGQDGVLSQANLLENSNFDLVEDDGEALKVWKRYNSTTASFNLPLNKSECIVEGEGLGFNAIYKTYTTGGGVITQGTQKVNLRVGLKYTLSCYSKYDGDKPNSSSNSVANTYGYGITFSGTAASKFKASSRENVYATNFGSSSAGSAEVYFGIDNGNDAGWVKHSVTFEVTEDIPSVAFRLYAWAYNLDTGNTYYYSQLKLEVGEVATPYQKNQDDLQGKTGETSYQQGVWNADTTYKKTSLIAPYVLYSKKQGGDDRYYMLKANQAKGASQSPANGDYWVELTQFENLFAKFLMANWAVFGSERGGVFLDRYLFSQYGINKAGTLDTYGNYQTGDNAMFDDETTLNGKFSPNLFLDFFGGAIKTNRLSETFKEFDYLSPNEKAYIGGYGNLADSEWVVGGESNLPLAMNAYELDTDSSYNISVIPNRANASRLQKANGSNWGDTINYHRGNTDCRLVSMPLVDDIIRGTETVRKAPSWQPDGMRSTILVRESGFWNDIISAYEYNNQDDIKPPTKEDYNYDESWIKSDYLLSGLVLCADSRVIDQQSYYHQNENHYVTYYPKNYGTDSIPDTIPLYNDSRYGGFFVVNGEITKFLLVEPGTMVRLRSCTSYNPVNTNETFALWYVENSDDFVQVDADINFRLRHVYKGEEIKSVESLGLKYFDENDYDSEGNLGVWKPVEYFDYTIGYQSSGYKRNKVFASKGIALIASKEGNIGQKHIIIETDKKFFEGDPMSNIYQITM